MSIYCKSMNAHRWRRLCAGGIVLTITCLVVSVRAEGVEDGHDDPVLRPLATARSLFADRTTKFRFAVADEDASTERIVWSLSANDRTLSRGEFVVELDPEKPTEFDVSVDAPTIRDGVILQTTLIVSRKSTNNRSQPDWQQTIWIFPEDATADKHEWLTSLDIQLYDPKRTTANMLREAGIPFDTLHTQASLEAVKEGVAIVGAGLSLKENSQLAEIMVRLAAAGVPVLCLTPGDGVIPVSVGKTAKKSADGTSNKTTTDNNALGGGSETDGSETEGADSERAGATSRPQSITLRQSDIVSELDKRLDGRDWLAGNEVTRCFRFAVADDSVVAESVSPGQGWPWLEIRYPTKRGRLVLSGFGVIEEWDTSPIPRYLLLRILERISKTAPTPNTLSQGN